MAKARKRSKMNSVCCFLDKCIKEVSILLCFPCKHFRHLMFKNVVEVLTNRLEVSCSFHIIISRTRGNALLFHFSNRNISIRLKDMSFVRVVSLFLMLNTNNLH